MIHVLRGALRRWAMRVRRRPYQVAALLAAWSVMLAMVARVVAPWFDDLSSYGFHDWDVETSFRYLVKLSLLEYHQFPGWNPYACGGYPSWGYVEGATNLVSAWLPAYLWAPLPLALRIEAAGMGLLGAAGAYAWCSRFTRSHGARLLVAALWAVNGRWGLQTAAGHTWHLAYAYLPWCGFFFERACRPVAALSDRVGLGVGFAMLVYAGGIYPLPHTVLVLGLYATLRSLSERRMRPLLRLATGGLIGLGLAAPKLLPVLDTFATDPRLIPSTETLSPGALITLLTFPKQGFGDRPAMVQPYGWHEWGMYISWLGVIVCVAGVVLVRGRREQLLKVVGALLVVLGFGAFHRWAPWSLLHEHLPVFRSQHVPSRFLYPAVLVLGLVAAAGIGRFVDRWRHSRPWLDLLLVGVVALLALDVASVAQQPMAQSMWMKAPEIPQGRPFSFSVQPPYQYLRRDWAGPMLLSMMANTGVLNCYGVPREPGFRWHAKPRSARDYRGETYVVGGGQARLDAWSPNRVDIGLARVAPGATLVYNMHYFRGWHARVDGRDVAVAPHAGLVALRLPAGARRVELRYTPPRLGWGLAWALATLTALAWAWRRQRALDSEMSA